MGKMRDSRFNFYSSIILIMLGVITRIILFCRDYDGRPIKSTRAVYRVTYAYLICVPRLESMIFYHAPYVKPPSRTAAARPLPRDNIQRVYREKIELKSLKCLLTFSIIHDEPLASK